MFFRENTSGISLWSGILVAFVVMSTAVISFGAESKSARKQQTFHSPEEAVQALVTATRNNDDKKLMTIFGPSAQELLHSGDAVADNQRREHFLKAYSEKNSLVSEKGGMVVVIGKDDWPFPLPLVKKGEVWFFDTDKGKEEILNRRIGANELNSIQTCLAIVDAQREYARKDVDDDGLWEYAGKFMSDPGKKNGLYWETREGEEASPLGAFAAQARKEGYSKKKPGDKPAPFHGYYFRILTAQGKNAPGGAADYVVKGKLIGGFALVASPAKYGNSGVMTFMVNHEGVVYEKDLGKNTAKVAKAIKKFDPDKTWKKVKEAIK